MSGSTNDLYLVDASSYVYRAFFALPPLTTPNGAPIQAVYGFTTMLLKLLRVAKPSLLAVVFDAPGRTFRDDLYADYKAKRPPLPADLTSQFPIVREVTAALGVQSLSVDGVEADDVIATMVERAVAQVQDVVVVTSDKDLMQVIRPGVRLWDTMRDRWYDTDAVVEKFGVQPAQIVDLIGLMGDAVDNIPGVRGIGEKTARVLIRSFGSLDGVLAHLDEVAQLPSLRGARRIAEALGEQAGQARLSRDLAHVRTDVPIDLPLTELRYSSPCTEALRALFARLGFQKLLKDLPGSLEIVTVDASIIGEPAAVDLRLAEAVRASWVAVGCDSSIPGEPALLTTFGEGSVSIIPANVAAAASVLTRLSQAGTELVAHDLKQMLRKLGLESLDTSRAFDTMVASYVGEATSTHRLEDLSAELLSTNLASGNADSASPAKVAQLLPLRQHLEPRLIERGVSRLFHHLEMPLVGVLARMEKRGVRVDTDALAELATDMHRRQAVMEAEIYALAGGELNISSPPQLRAVLFDRLGLSTRGVKRGKTGLSTDADVLGKLAAQHPLPAKILEYRALTKLKSTYVEALPLAVDGQTGRLHTTFNQTVAATGRLSSSNPNLQNIPIRGEDGQRIRAAFVAAEGARLVVADYSQVELRVLAHLSGDAVLTDAFRRGEDIHARTAAEIFGVLPGTVSREMRRTAKVINFGVLYGMGAQALSRELGVPVSAAESYIRNYFERYSGVREYLETTRRLAHAQGFVTTILGRRRTLPELASRDRNLVQAAERIATNTPIQGSAADLMKLAMVRIDRRLVGSFAGRAALILQVHDELVVEASEESCDSICNLVREEMAGAMELRVPLVVDVGVGGSWVDAHQ